MTFTCDWFDPAKIAASGQCFRWKRVNSEFGIRNSESYVNSKLQGYAIHHACDKIVITPMGGDVYDVSCGESEFNSTWREYLDLSTDYHEIAAMVDPRDGYLVEAVEASKGLRVLRQDFWEMFISFIVSQNNNISRITKIVDGMCEAYGAFPSAHDIVRDASPLVRLKLGYRLPYITRAAEKYICDGTESFIHNLSYDEAKAYLMSYHGVGAKVADCVCLYGLSHRSAFPRDVWMKRIESAHYNGRFDSEKYGRHAGVMQMFMFYYERNRGGVR